MARILIVDDSPTDQHASRKALESAGHDVVTADTAQDGINLAKTHQPDLILMDVVFEGMSGFSGTRKLTRDPETKGIPVIICSSKDQESDRVWGLRQGAVEYLVKPVDPKVLTDAVDSAIKYRPV